MNDSDRVLLAKIEIMKNGMLIITEKLRSLADPVGAMKMIIEGMLEEGNCEGIRDRLAGINTAADSCIKIIRELTELTMRYYEQGQDE